MTAQLKYITELTPESAAVVVIKRISEIQNHVGIGYLATGQNQHNLLHLAWHYKPLKAQLNTSYYWVQHELPALRIIQLAAFCRLIAQANPFGLPYAFSVPNDCFDLQTGQYLIGSSQCGLTCATFVLAAFQAVGLALVRLDSWPPNRDGDREWQQHILACLRQEESTGNVNQAHIQEVQNQCGALRFRPEEVAGSSAARSFPVGYEETRNLANDVLRQLSEKTPID